VIRCNRPPSGWYCTRPYGHLGPCAAHPLRPHGKSYYTSSAPAPAPGTYNGQEATHVWMDEAKSFSFPDAPAMPSSEPASFDSGGGGDFGGGGSDGSW
jgi:hypothetical protein